MGATLFDKVWDRHVVADLPDGGTLLYVDRHLVHEVTSPQAFDALRVAGRRVRRPDLTFATVDHNVPTDGRTIDETTLSGQQLTALKTNCQEFGVPLFGYRQAKQGIVHVIGPALGITLPGCTMVCGDSHTSTHGAFGALAFGIGTTEVEHVLATQTLRAPKKPKSLGIEISGELANRVVAKDVILAIIKKLGASGGTGYVAEYFGSTIQAMGMSARMTICNMSIEMGARAGMIAPDQTTIDFITAEPRPYAPSADEIDQFAPGWLELASDPDCKYDRLESLNIDELVPQVTWGTTPAMTVDIDGCVPEPANDAEKRAQTYMGVHPGEPMHNLTIDVVFIGSCTNSRIEDLRIAAELAKGRRVASSVRAIVVPGSETVRRQATKEGLDQVLMDAGFEWHHAGCSMCLGMNGDILRPMQRSASTSNRPYEGRQGPGSRTHLVSPATAVASAIHGRLTDPRHI